MVQPCSARMAAVMVSKAARGGGCGSRAGQGDAAAGGGCPEVGEQGGGALEVFVGDMAAAVAAAAMGSMKARASARWFTAAPWHRSKRARSDPDSAARGGSGRVGGGHAGGWFRGIPRNPRRAGRPTRVYARRSGIPRRRPPWVGVTTPLPSRPGGAGGGGSGPGRPARLDPLAGGRPVGRRPRSSAARSPPPTR
jgi:hypothetical protein